MCCKYIIPTLDHTEPNPWNIEKRHCEYRICHHLISFVFCFFPKGSNIGSSNKPYVEEARQEQEERHSGISSIERHRTTKGKDALKELITEKD
mmetsp:Transcript_19095/g.28288  ORF Transcript_19095/g.28288 Transcript_19095/m.28288 type:complete len:93 (+) Transcript_19095:714-992(+)